MREITIALAESPAVRNTRLSYQIPELEFYLLLANSLAEAATDFQHNRDEACPNATPKRWLSGDVRSCGGPPETLTRVFCVKRERLAAQMSKTRFCVAV